MAAFSGADVESIDYKLLRYGATTLFRRPALFSAAIDELAALGYLVHRIDARAPAPFIAGLTEALRFHENLGYTPWTGDLNALNDAFREVVFDDHRGVAFARAITCSSVIACSPLFSPITPISTSDHWAGEARPGTGGNG